MKDVKGGKVGSGDDPARPPVKYDIIKDEQEWDKEEVAKVEEQPKKPLTGRERLLAEMPGLVIKDMYG